MGGAFSKHSGHALYFISSSMFKKRGSDQNPIVRNFTTELVVSRLETCIFKAFSGLFFFRQVVMLEIGFLVIGSTGFQ